MTVDSNAWAAALGCWLDSPTLHFASAMSFASLEMSGFVDLSIIGVLSSPFRSRHGTPHFLAIWIGYNVLDSPMRDE